MSTFKVGNPKEPDTIVGPLINRVQFDQVKNSVDKAVSEGARILCGGTSEGLCYHPTVVTNVKPGSAFSCEETFGPVVSIIEVENAEEALAVANSTTYGLSASVFTNDFMKGLDLADASVRHGPHQRPDRA